MSRTKFDSEEMKTWPKGTKRCWGCKELLPLGSFHAMKQGVFGVNTYCKTCRKPKSQTHYKALSFEKTMWQSAKGRASRLGRDFSITVDDIKIPTHCPILGVPLVLERNSWYAPSLDRIDPDQGYTPSNVMVMSKRANMLKSNTTLDEVKLLLAFLENSML